MRQGVLRHWWDWEEFGLLGGDGAWGLVLLWGISVSWRTDATGGTLVLWRCYGGTGAVGGLQVEMTAQCWALLVQWAPLGRSELESLAEDTASLGLPGAPGPSRDPPHTPSSPRRSPLPG